MRGNPVHPVIRGALPRSRPTKEVAIAVDLGGTNLSLALVDHGMEILCRDRRPSMACRARSNVIDNLLDAIAAIVGRAHEASSRPIGIGIGLPGIVDDERGVLRRAAHLPRLRDVPIARILRSEFGLPVRLAHDVDLAAIAEAHYGAGRGCRHIVCITIGTGIGVGMILNGELYRGTEARAGNLGHMILARDPGERSAKRDSLEQIASGSAIRAKAIAMLEGGARSSLVGRFENRFAAIDARAVFEAARTGDAVSLRIVDEAATAMGIAIANVIHLLGPDVVVLGGGVAEAGPMLLSRVRTVVRRHLYAFSPAAARIVEAQRGRDASLLGAAHLVWQEHRPLKPCPGSRRS